MSLTQFWYREKIWKREWLAIKKKDLWLWMTARSSNFSTFLDVSGRRWVFFIGGRFTDWFCRQLLSFTLRKERGGSTSFWLLFWRRRVYSIARGTLVRVLWVFLIGRRWRHLIIHAIYVIACIISFKGKSFHVRLRFSFTCVMNFKTCLDIAVWAVFFFYEYYFALIIILYFTFTLLFNKT